MKEVEVITIYDKDGHVKPFRFRVTAEDQSLLVVNIDKILYCDEIKKDALRYRCECVISRMKRLLDLYFYKTKMKWYLKVNI